MTENIIKSILIEFGPCSSTEILDFIKSDLFLEKGFITSEEWTQSKIQYQLDKLTLKNDKFFKFQSNSGYKNRYGLTKFQFYLLYEPRYLKVKGYLKHCMFCGMPIYINGTDVFHFRYKCNQYQEQENFKLIKVQDFWAIISRDFVFGVLDNLHSSSLRLPGWNQNRTNSSILSELWLINEKAREMDFIEFDRLLPLNAEEYIA